MASKTWFITGISRGFGKALAEAALAKGDTVIGTTRDGTTSITDETGRLNVLPMDITYAASIPEIIKCAVNITGRLDVVVNNAGYGLLGSVEEASENEIEHLFDVNFHGTRRVVQAVLPYLRQQKSGHIVNITSIAGLAPSAGSGYYAAAKFAVEGMSQSLAQEIGPLGIKLTLVEPGAFRTDFLSEHSIRIRPLTIGDYAETAGKALAYLEKMAGEQAGDPARAADAIIHVVEASEPPLHLVLGPDAFRRTQEKHEQFAAELKRWKDVSLSTNFK
ncbi:Short-chain dehydrogenase [Paramixta manurensis]|uniref:Short-chain dehydrogenase n=1 Tax=Paramixta manurensis TaxID=2740817 RepID=A0A6M8UBM4_9GAMM|nr:Short-chain dehydrogenase [Erwiniaceae bacterium PD-1]